MNAPTRLAIYGMALVAVFAASLGVGAAIGPSPSDRDGAEEENVSGLRSSERGYTFVPDTTVLTPGEVVDFGFRITGPDGRVVTDFRSQHERDLHLIVASRDLNWFAHVHPVRDGTGHWTVALRLPAPGPFRAFADFAATEGPVSRSGGRSGPVLTLGVDLTSPGEYRPLPWPAPAAAALVDGYTVTLAGAPTHPGDAEITLNVAREGRPVTNLDPYLGAYGHVVALRAGDLAYLHVHPDGEPGDGRTRPGSDVRFGLHLPRAGDYRLFFDFQHEGIVHTAAFSVSVAAPSSSRTPTTAGSHGNAH